MPLSVQVPFPVFQDRDGQPLDAGYVWIGQPYLASQTNPLQVYFDRDLTIPAAQPLRTLNGYISNAGTPAQVYVDSPNFSILVQDKKGTLVYNFGDATGTTGFDSESISYLAPYIQSVPTNVELKLSERISLRDFGAVGDGVADDTAAIQAAINAASGRIIYAPAGTYKVTSTLNYSPSIYDGVFGAGLKLIGDGPLKTYIDNQVNGVLINATTPSTGSLFRGAIGAVFENFTIKRSITTTNGTGIKITAAYNPSIKNIHINGMSNNGIEIPCTLGDNDGSNMVNLEHVRIENCAGWGIKADGNSGFNETSFIHMRHVFIQACGTANVAYQPPSGGMAWKGQILTMQQCAFTLNENCALWIPGSAGLGQNVDLQSTTFENNKSRGLFCRGISAFKARNIQFYNNNSYTASVACEFEGDSFVIRQIDIDGVTVRATSGNNAYTAFKISGANTDFNSCRVRRVVWDNFDYAGQTRFNGWQFDKVELDCDLVALSGTDLRLRPNLTFPHGNKMPLRLRGGGGGVPSTSGEIVPIELTSAGIAITNAGLAANTRYYAYLYDNNNIPSLELSTDSFIYSSLGYPVKSTDTTRIYVGSVQTDAGTLFRTTAGGWLNPILIPASQVGTYRYVWFDASALLRSNASAPTNDTDGTLV